MEEDGAQGGTEDEALCYSTCGSEISQTSLTISKAFDQLQETFCDHRRRQLSKKTIWYSIKSPCEIE